MDFLKALKLAVSVIREQRELDEIYLYEISSQTRVYLKNCKTERLSATRAMRGKTSELFIDYTPVGKEEVQDV